MNARNRSTKSCFIRKLAAQPPLFLAQTPHLKHALRVGELPPEFDVMTIRFRGVGESSNRDAAHAFSRIGVGHGLSLSLSGVTPIEMRSDEPPVLPFRPYRRLTASGMRLPSGLRQIVLNSRS